MFGKKEEEVCVLEEGNMVYFEDYIFYSFDRDLFDSSRIFLICVFSEFERIEIYYMRYEIKFFRFFLKVEIYYFC